MDTFTDTFNSDVTDENLVEIPDGSTIVIVSYLLATKGDIGTVALDIEDNKVVGRLYSSQGGSLNNTTWEQYGHNFEHSKRGLEIYGGNGDNLQLTATASGAELFVSVTYEIERID